MKSGKHQRIALSAGLIAITLTTGLGWSGPSVSNVWADQVPPVQLGGMEEGQITAVGLTFLEVERRSYRLDPKVEVRTEGGQPLELKQLQTGMGVRFKLKDGAMALIIAVLPR